MGGLFFGHNLDRNMGMENGLQPAKSQDNQGFLVFFWCFFGGWMDSSLCRKVILTFTAESRVSNKSRISDDPLSSKVDHRNGKKDCWGDHITDHNFCQKANSSTRNVSQFPNPQHSTPNIPPSSPFSPCQFSLWLPGLQAASGRSTASRTTFGVAWRDLRVTSQMRNSAAMPRNVRTMGLETDRKR